MKREVFEYAVVRVVPRVERGERVNAGVIVYCKARSFLAARCALDVGRLRALDAGVDVVGVERALEAVELVCRGGEDGGGGGGWGGGGWGGGGVGVGGGGLGV